MKPGYFRATCRKYHADGKTRCDEVFHDGPALEAHMKTVHPGAYSETKRTVPVMARPRTRPYGRPAVALEKQVIPPGTRFTYKGHPCQVVGAVSASRTRYLVWLPENVDPARKGALRHWWAGMDENGRWLWELTAETKKVAEAVAASEEEK